MYRMRKEKTNWKMQNVNPQGKDCDDCVFRAIAGGTGISWKDTFAGLCQTGLSLHAMPDYPIVFRKYLKEIGARYVYKSAQAHAHTEDEASTADMTAEEFIRQHPKGNYVLRLWWHVTCTRDGFLYDTWDASSENCSKRGRSRRTSRPRRAPPPHGSTKEASAASLLWKTSTSPRARHFFLEIQVP